MNRLDRQLGFIIELDKLKSVRRRTLLTDGTRWENSAEHSWHLALTALVLAEYADDGPDMTRVIELLLLHDVVEIDADDTFCYDEAAAAGQADRELAAANRLFGSLPEDQAARFRELWNEFESGRTPESRFARAIDRLQPLLQNLSTRGRSWREHGVKKSQVVQRTAETARASERLHRCIQALIDEAVAKGYLQP
ncbi:MAG: HD domain-containing protein [Desulfobacterales bacterium]|jgi:putative hydrolase of HD superfamily